jgi:hypothetical protein
MSVIRSADIQKSITIEYGASFIIRRPAMFSDNHLAPVALGKLESLRQLKGSGATNGRL